MRIWPARTTASAPWPTRRASIPVGLNAAIRAARYPIIVRVDAHTELPPDYTQHAVATLERTGAANVGGIMLARGESAFQSAVARAYNSPLGLGGGDYHDADATEGPNESAYLGVFRADALAAVGGYDESVRPRRGLGTQPPARSSPAARCGSTPACT